MVSERMRNLWYRDAIIYCLDVETFQDSDGDGIGDFGGLTDRLDYLAGLGVNCLWILPFYPSPNRDNGYDVIDYYGVDKRLGTFGDFVEFIHQAGERGIRVIVDLVVNHTSDQHRWFQAARSDPNSVYRDYYVWKKEKPADAHKGTIFPGVQESIWTYDEQAEAYYLHRFYEHQPDLNIANPAVREEICKIMGFWLQLGVSGFRLDAAPFLIELKGIDGVHDGAEPYDYLEQFRDYLSWRRGDAILLAEANVPMDEIPHYFGKGNRIHMLFNFLLNQRVFLALARKQAAPIAEAFQEIPHLEGSAQWANFLRNHDELDLGRLSDEEREFVFAEFAPDEHMQLYHRGIRRRLPPMLGNDQRRLRMAYSLMFSLPGTPVLRYGEEIGMGDDLSLPERNSVRTAMQWSDEKNGGFSDAPAEALARPAIHGGEYGYEQLNVNEQRRDRGSLLNWMEHVIRARRECPEFGQGDWDVLESGDPAVFAHRVKWRNGVLVAIHNLCNQPRTIDLPLDGYDAEHLVNMLGDRSYLPVDETRQIELDGYGYRWFRLIGEGLRAY